MKNHSLLYIAFGWFLLLGTAHLIAGFFYFYWTVWWFDNAMHFLGGLSMGFFSLWIAHATGLFRGKVPSFASIMMVVFASALVIGAGWEVFEYIFDISNPSIGQTYASDTSYDLFLDLLGAVVAGFWARSPRFYLPKRNG